MKGTVRILSSGNRAGRFRKYISFFRIRFINGLQYRTAAYAGIATQFAWGTMRILMFRAFYQADPGAFPMDFQALSCYVWLEQAFLALFAPWSFDNDIFAMIRDGSIAYELTRPVDLYGMWFTKNLALRVSRAVLRCVPILIVAAFLPAPYGMTLPADPVSFVMFLVTGALGACVVVSFMMMIYIACFHTLNPQGIRIIAISVTDILSGSVIPLPFLPDGIRFAVELTPFGYMMNLPLRVYSGDIAGAEMLWGTALQVVWLFVMTVLGRLWMKRSLKKIVVQGG